MLHEVRDKCFGGGLGDRFPDAPAGHANHVHDRQHLQARDRADEHPAGDQDHTGDEPNPTPAPAVDRLVVHDTWGICTRRAGKLYKARSRLYRSQFLQVNTRWN